MPPASLASATPWNQDQTQIKQATAQAPPAQPWRVTWLVLVVLIADITGALVGLSVVMGHVCLAAAPCLVGLARTLGMVARSLEVPGLKAKPHGDTRG